jgi:uncharacterized protein YndB with AHSA1/START domain
MMRAATLAAAVCVCAAPAWGEVVDAQPGGFTVRQSVLITASPARVWAALGRVGAWWDSAHTYSGDARNLTLQLRPGGAWMERLPGGGVLHMTVVNAQPGKLARFEGALGPLQGLGVAGQLTINLRASGEATAVTQVYDVGGHAPGGLAALAAPVDAVLAAQLARLKSFVEIAASAPGS